jgi:hypothetical protein
VETVNEGFSVGSYEDRTDGGNAGWVSGNELLPETPFSSRQIHTVNFGGNLSGLINEKSMTVLTPAGRQIARLESRNQPRLSFS